MSYTGNQLAEAMKIIANLTNSLELMQQINSELKEKLRLETEENMRHRERLMDQDSVPY